MDCWNIAISNCYIKQGNIPDVNFSKDVDTSMIEDLIKDDHKTITQLVELTGMHKSSVYRRILKPMDDNKVEVSSARPNGKIALAYKMKSRRS